MKRFVLPVQPGPEGMVRLYEKDYHYLVRVRRLKPGSCFDAILPCGEETRIRILSTVDNILIGECAEENLRPADSRRPCRRQYPPIALFQGLPKGGKMDLIVRQAAEGGVSLVAPFESEYSAVRLRKDAAGKITRWEKIAREARQQSGSAVETEIKPPFAFDDLLEYWESLKKKYSRPLGILLHQEPLEKGSFHEYLGNCPDFIALAVGPEGGFSPREVSLFLAAGWRPLLMGNTVLRTETAAIYGIAAIRIILLESESWMPKESCSLKSPST
jgi:16S rRNA (uracil1498-N3)-methyltransferase